MRWPADSWFGAVRAFTIPCLCERCWLVGKEHRRICVRHSFGF
ncbi:hypothetical protein HMPREF9997_02868 [Corynebacterium durum F0235]|uniref:Uncharacterized protein n=1 Tax=Corynebacterium durum F0235 TaxID=1035195 RepID=L1M8J3_9CORY|nr:hypothetical protein HMPREF9997_02868 [Corynebacterium durum F0235]